jgi:glycosyltransferase involved in cell wall biosynthesis
LVLLEALASGTPALASRCSSLPEVGGQAVAWVSRPREVDEWSVAIEQLLNDAARRESMRAQGLEQARHFDWRVTAERTLALYEQLLA